MNDMQKLLAEAMRTPGPTIITKANFHPAVEVPQGLVEQPYQHSQYGDIHRMQQKPSLRRSLEVLIKRIVDVIVSELRENVAITYIVVFIEKVLVTRRACDRGVTLPMQVIRGKLALVPIQEPGTGDNA